MDGSKPSNLDRFLKRFNIPRAGEDDYRYAQRALKTLQITNPEELESKCTLSRDQTLKEYLNSVQRDFLEELEDL